MGYILEIITINRKENLFWISMLEKEGRIDTLNGYQAWHANFLQSYVDKGFFINDKVEMTHDNFQDENGHWLAIRRFGLFKEAPMASDFFKDLNEHPVSYRREASKWTAEQGMTGEVNILTNNEKIAVVASSCQTGVCGRKDGSTSCPTGPLACHDPEKGFDPKESSIKQYHVPLRSFIKFKTK